MDTNTVKLYLLQIKLSVVIYIETGNNTVSVEYIGGGKRTFTLFIQQFNCYSLATQRSSLRTIHAKLSHGRLPQASRAKGLHPSRYHLAICVMVFPTQRQCHRTWISLGTESTVQEALTGYSTNGKPTAKNTGCSAFSKVYSILLVFQHTTFPTVLLVTVV